MIRCHSCCPRCGAPAGHDRLPLADVNEGCRRGPPYDPSEHGAGLAADGKGARHLTAECSTGKQPWPRCRCRRPRSTIAQSAERCGSVRQVSVRRQPNVFRHQRCDASPSSIWKTSTSWSIFRTASDVAEDARKSRGLRDPSPRVD